MEGSMAIETFKNPESIKNRQKEMDSGQAARAKQAEAGPYGPAKGRKKDKLHLYHHLH